jgi:hypothetical protein
MKKRRFIRLATSFVILCLAFGNELLLADVPQTLHHQGQVFVDGRPFTGEADFLFAIVNATNGGYLWTNDGNTPPTTPVRLSVSEGVYAVLLGGTGMNPLPPSVFDNSNTRLRIWFGGSQLSPDLPLASVPYAFRVADGAVKASSIADGAVGSAKIADGTIVDADISSTAAISGSKLGPGIDAANITTGTLPIARIADGAVTSAKITDGTITNADISSTAAISGSKLGPGIDAANITTGTLPIARIADGAVTSAKITDGTITNADISSTAAIAWSKVSKSGASPGDVGAAAASHTHSANDITSGGTISGNITTTGSLTVNGNTYLGNGGDTVYVRAQSSSESGNEGGEIELAGPGNNSSTRAVIDNYQGQLYLMCSNVKIRDLSRGDTAALHAHTLYATLVQKTIDNFYIDHPSKPGMKLVHGTLEGPELGVYYRGEARLINGQAEIALPDYFEALTRKEGRTVQVTPKLEGEGPISALAASAVENGSFSVRGLDSINPSQPFYWEVKAVRADVEPLAVEVFPQGGE